LRGGSIGCGGSVILLRKGCSGGKGKSGGQKTTEYETAKLAFHGVYLLHIYYSYRNPQSGAWLLRRRPRLTTPQ
jgi:hypothetical protein